MARRETVDRLLLVAVRVLLGLMWLQAVGWKQPPDFGRLANFVQGGIDNPTLPLFSDVLDGIVQPNIELFGWVVLVVEISLAVGLLFGLATRLAGLVGAATSLFIGLTVASVPGEWGWSYWLMTAGHLAVYASPAAGRVAGLDATLRRRLPSSGGVGRFYHRWAS